jgi:hypothetical protein
MVAQPRQILEVFCSCALTLDDRAYLRLFRCFVLITVWFHVERKLYFKKDLLMKQVYFMSVSLADKVILFCRLMLPSEISVLLSLTLFFVARALAGEAKVCLRGQVLWQSAFGVTSSYYCTYYRVSIQKWLKKLLMIKCSNVLLRWDNSIIIDAVQLSLFLIFLNENLIGTKNYRHLNRVNIFYKNFGITKRKADEKILQFLFLTIFQLKSTRNESVTTLCVLLLLHWRLKFVEAYCQTWLWVPNIVKQLDFGTKKNSLQNFRFFEFRKRSFQLQVNISRHSGEIFQQKYAHSTRNDTAFRCPKKSRKVFPEWKVLLVFRLSQFRIDTCTTRTPSATILSHHHNHGRARASVLVWRWSCRRDWWHTPCNQIHQSHSMWHITLLSFFRRLSIQDRFLCTGRRWE